MEIENKEYKFENIRYILCELYDVNKLVKDFEEILNKELILLVFGKKYYKLLPKILRIYISKKNINRPIIYSIKILIELIDNKLCKKLNILKKSRMTDGYILSNIIYLFSKQKNYEDFKKIISRLIESILEGPKYKIKLFLYMYSDIISNIVLDGDYIIELTKKTRKIMNSLIFNEYLIKYEYYNDMYINLKYLLEIINDSSIELEKIYNIGIKKNNYNIVKYDKFKKNIIIIKKYKKENINIILYELLLDIKTADIKNIYEIFIDTIKINNIEDINISYNSFKKEIKNNNSILYSLLNYVKYYWSFTKWYIYKKEETINFSIEDPIYL
jgi:hypothetical protein